MSTTTGVASPCVNVCRMDLRSGWCEGCLRTLDEIAAWSTMADRDKLAVHRQLRSRREAAARLRQGGAPHGASE